MVFKRLDLICQDVVSRLDAEEFGGSEPIRASQEKGGDRLPATGGGTDSRSPIAEGETPRIGTEKPRTRSADHWTVKKPPKRAGAVEVPASALEGIQVKQAESLFILPIAGRDMATARKRAEPHGSAVVISLAVWKEARGHGLPSS